jgi:hypothetical protein
VSEGKDEGKYVHDEPFKNRGSGWKIRMYTRIIAIGKSGCTCTGRIAARRRQENEGER